MEIGKCILIFLIFSVILISGCLGNDAILNIAKSSPEVQDFLSEYPDAQINVRLLKEESVQQDNDFIMHCSGSKSSDYYKITLTDEESGLNSFVFVDQEKGVICAFKEGGGKKGGEKCIEDWDCSGWSECENGVQVRVCTDDNECGTFENQPSESRSCQVTCSEDWECSVWSDCVDEVQTRTCTDRNGCGTVINKPLTSQSCISSCTCTCEDWSGCYPEGYQTRDCSCSNCEPDEMVETMRDCVPETETCDEKYLEEFRCKDEKTVQKKYQLADCSIQWEDWYTCGDDYKCISDEDPSKQCDKYTCSEMGGEICGENENCENDDIKYAKDTYSCCISSCVFDTSSQTCEEQGGYEHKAYYKCPEDYIEASDTNYCCPVELVPKTCDDFGYDSCETDEICPVSYIGMDTLDFYKEMGILCCRETCEPLPVCGNGICEYREEQTDFESWAVLCNSDSGDPAPIGFCQVQSCPEDC